MPRYRLHCPAEQTDELPEDVKIVERYEAFQVVDAPASTIASLQSRFPAEPLADRPASRAAAAGPRATDIAARGLQRAGRDFLVQFQGPIKPSWLDEVRRAGLEVLRAEGDRAVVVACSTQRKRSAVEAMPHVTRVVPFEPVIKLGPDFIAQLGPVSADESELAAVSRAVAEGNVPGTSRRNASIAGVLSATFFNQRDRDAAERAYRRAGIRQLTSVGDRQLIINLVGREHPADDLAAIVQRPGLERLEERKLKTPSNNVARQVIGARVVTNHGSRSLQLTGAGEVVAVADTGLDTGNASTVHLDFRDRVRAIDSWPIAPSYSDLVTNPGADDGARDRFSGHGTHVAGSVIGNGARAAALRLTETVAGMAPEAELVFQAIEQVPKWTPEAELMFLRQGVQPPASGLFGIPDDLTELFQQAYDRGARIHNNSWGGGDPGEYDEQCLQLDQFVWDHPDFLVVVAAGNSGLDARPKDGAIDPRSVDSPGTAKNCLTVGASENRRGDDFSDTYGDWWPRDYPAPALRDDPMTDSIDDIAAFSSRGPCATGRRKPDVIAPGTFVLSTRSSQMPANNFSWGAFAEAKRDYMFMGGTSMAAPLVAGAATLVRQFLRSNAEIADPSAALLKATLVHSARYLDYRYKHSTAAPYADNEQGWGRVDLAAVLRPPRGVRVLWRDVAPGLTTGGQDELVVKISGSSSPLRVTLAYTDPPGERLVNNLNLIVAAPNGKLHLGNDFKRRGRFDSTNNVEGIIVPRPAAGRWTVRVVGVEVQQGPQPYALCISGRGAKIV